MKPITIFITACLLVLTSCQSPPAAPTVTATALPTETASPTATATTVPTPNDVFGVIPLNSVQAFSIEPVAKAIFEHTLQTLVDAKTIDEYRVDRIAVFPSGNGVLVAEIFYSLRTDADPWLEDGGIPNPEGWITGKCARFDLVATETEQQLQKKRLCS